MKNIYEEKPVLESENFKLRPLEDRDLKDLFKVYSDKNALPFFNSDNCNGDNFYYATEQRMKEALDFWKTALENRWFARLAIEGKNAGEVIGTVEICLRVSEDAFNNMCILRVDVGSKYEKTEILEEIFNLLEPNLSDLIGSKGVLTKGPLYAVERTKALENCGFTKSENYLYDGKGFAFDCYWTK